MLRFVAREGDLGGAAALEVLKAAGCLTVSLNGDGKVGPQDVVFFTGDPKMHWPSKWLRISKEPWSEKFLPPAWARHASKVIGVRPGKDCKEIGFATAIVNVAQSLGAVAIPPKVKKGGRVRSRSPYFYS